jgi:hypothetical protein
MTIPTDNTSCGSDISSRSLYSDMIIAYPTMENYVSYRPATGSWFIQDLCKVFGNTEHTNALDIKELLDNVAFELSKRKDGNNVQNSEYSVIGMIKKLYFPRR